MPLPLQACNAALLWMSLLLTEKDGGAFTSNSNHQRHFAGNAVSTV